MRIINLNEYNLLERKLEEIKKIHEQKRKFELYSKFALSAFIIYLMVISVMAANNLRNNLYNADLGLLVAFFIPLVVMYFAFDFLLKIWGLKR